MKERKRPLTKPQKAKAKALYRLLEGVSEATQNKIFRILQDQDIDPDDPLFLLLVAMTHAQVSLSPLPEKIGAIQAALQTLCDDAQLSFQKHQELNYDFYVTVERLSTQLNRTLSELEDSQVRAPGHRSLRAMVLWCFMASVIGGLVGALLITTITIVSAAQ